MASFSNRPANAASPAPAADYSVAMISLIILFFMMGFITCLNDVLIPVLKGAFALNYAQSMLVQTCFFSAYLVMSIPSGLLLQRIGYKQGMLLGFVIAGIGCLLFYPAASARSYPVFLSALFILATGITLLQVAANPYVSILGRPETASSRLTLAQAFNSAGTTIAPQFGAWLILDQLHQGELTVVQVNENLAAVQLPYIGLAVSLFLIAGVLTLLRLPAIKAQDVASAEHNAWADTAASALGFRHLTWGIGGIFCYVGAEVAIGSLLILFMKKYAGMDEVAAGRFLSYYWGGAMAGRFLASMAMRYVRPTHALTFNALAAVLLVSTAIVADGTVAMWALIAVGLCNSLMFPTIFTLSVAGLGRHTDQGSGLLSTAIFGGAAIPLVQGLLADYVQLQPSFVLPLLCYLYIAWYGWKGSKPDKW